MMQKASVSITLDADVLARASRAADARGQPLSRLVSRVLREFLDEAEDDDRGFEKAVIKE